MKQLKPIRIEIDDNKKIKSWTTDLIREEEKENYKLIKSKKENILKMLYKKDPDLEKEIKSLGFKIIFTHNQSIVRF